MATKNAVFQVVLFSIFLAIANSFQFNYPTIFNFGDSNSDTGELAAGLGLILTPPNGQNYFKIPSGRFCDGRLIVDFLSNNTLLLYSNYFAYDLSLDTIIRLFVI
ncbi:putative alpha-L-fucosidase [Lupinus albus]|uniref:Putative alpha-L-fucosidase n=1 Tax=Lupinus albus TaxID=3870 RepID=A0A6A4P3W2_LUPAL|nr:putative alpha-L-fucosidase [Lupinus albus]